MAALDLYRTSFRPSSELSKPYAMIGVNVICADTDEEAQRLATSAYQQFLNIIRGRTGQLSPPVDSMDDLWNLQEQAIVKRQLSFSAIGSPATVRARLEQFQQSTNADEIIVAAIYDHEARLRSYERWRMSSASNKCYTKRPVKPGIPVLDWSFYIYYSVNPPSIVTSEPVM